MTDTPTPASDEGLVERVARAIFFRGEAEDEVQWRHMQPHYRELAIEQARAAIKAMSK